MHWAWQYGGLGTTGGIHSRAQCCGSEGRALETQTGLRRRSSLKEREKLGAGQGTGQPIYVLKGRTPGEEDVGEAGRSRLEELIL